MKALDYPLHCGTFMYVIRQIFTEVCYIDIEVQFGLVLLLNSLYLLRLRQVSYNWALHGTIFWCGS